MKNTLSFKRKMASHSLIDLNRCRLGLFVYGVFSILIATTILSASEVVVDQSAKPGGDGSPGAPFQTISEALKVTLGGGIIVVRGGVYPEEILITNGGTQGTPLVIRSAPGEVVEISGFDPLEGWQDEGGGIYSLKSPERITSLYVGARRQPVARFPKSDQSWIRVVAADHGKGVFELDQAPDISPGGKDMFVFTFLMGPKIAPTYLVTAFDASEKKVTLNLEGEQFAPQIGDFIVFCNAIEILNRPGEWICRQEEDQWVVYFKPKNPEDIKRTQTRTRSTLVRIRQASHVYLEDLTIAGAEEFGIYTSNAKDIKIKRCLVFNNGSTIGHGVRLDKSDDILLESCIIFANHFNGVAMIQGSNITIRGSLVTANDVDGITLGGRANSPKEPLNNVRLENNLVYGHLYLKHPDNTQIFNHVRDVVYDSNVMYLGGQNAMISDCENMTFENNLFFGTVARHVILGHNSSHHASFTNNTFGFADSALGTQAKNVSISRNVFFQTRLVYGSEDISGDHNLFWIENGSGPILSRTFPRWSGFESVEEFSAQHGFEANSKMQNPEYKNVPQAQVVGDFTFEKGGVSQLAVLPNDLAKFSAGMTIEINGDGVARTISEVSQSLIKFSPSLPAVPFRRPIIWIWPEGASMKLNFDSTKLSIDGKRIGSSVDFATYKSGDLLGLGKRSLPEMNSSAQEAMVEINNFVFPYFLPAQK